MTPGVDTITKANKRQPRTRQIVVYGLAALCLVAAGAVVVSFFERWPIENTSLALDWHSLYGGIQGGVVRYDTGMFIAPWSVPAVWPLGLLSFRASWGMIAFVTLAVLLVSVPYNRRGWMRWVSIIFLLTSFPALRMIADGNFEGIIIAGALLIVYGYRTKRPLFLAAGILLATAKVQESWLLAAILGVYILTSWPVRKQITLALALAAVVIPSFLWIGKLWLDAMFTIRERGSIMDMSLSAGLARLGISPVIAGLCWLFMLAVTVFVCLRGQRTMSREKAAMLIAVSLLLAPYAAGNSFLTVLAVGIIPLFYRQPRLGAVLFVLTDLQYVLPHDFLFSYGAWYWMVFLIFVWAVWAWRIYQTEIAGARELLLTPAKVGQT